MKSRLRSPDKSAGESARTSTTRPTRSLPEAALDRAIFVIDGPLNRAAERALKSRLLLLPAGLTLNLWCRGVIAVQTGDIKALWCRRRAGGGRARSAGAR